MATMRTVCASVLLAAGILVGLLPGAARAAASPDSLPAATAQRLGIPPDAPLAFVAVATSPDAGYHEAEAKKNAPDIRTLDACHVGGQRVLLRIGFARPPEFQGSTFIIYGDLDNNPATGRSDAAHRGVDLMVVLNNSQLNLTFHGTAFGPANTGARVELDGSLLYAAIDLPLPDGEGPLNLGLHLLSQRPDSRGDSTPHTVAALPRSALAVPKLPLGRSRGTRLLSEYRYHNDKVAYEKLADKGLRYDQVAPAKPIQFGRPCPEAPFAASGRHPERPGSVSRQAVPVGILDGAALDRTSAWLSFGFPLPQGALFDPGRLRLLGAGSEVPAQFTPTAFWPDDSLKWVLVDAAAPTRPEAQRDLAVEFGTDVRQTAPHAALRLQDEPARLVVVTGPLQVALDKRAFNLFASVWHDADADGHFAEGERVLAGAPTGVTLVDEHGKVFAMSALPPESVKIELAGPERAVVRVAGAYAANDGSRYMRYLVRLTFYAGSSRVDLALTHINDYLQTEFTDITSLRLPLRPSAGVRQAEVLTGAPDAAPVAGLPLRLLQWDDTQGTLSAGGRDTPVAKAPGLVRCRTGNGTFCAVLQDFWQRWPKGIAADADGLTVELLPEPPGVDYGTDLPYYLMYPFVEGKYRFKWGMAFTEHLSFDFGGTIPASDLLAEAQRPLVAVLPAEWYAQTGALGPLAAPGQKQFALWDAFVAGGFAAYMKDKERAREYGYFNYGDWFGERGRNWGNNEYDLAHGLFLQFARTGDREFYRWALTAARHQADVDCVHAYPDPYYIGANHQHSIGHTGTWSQDPEHATWSFRYDMHTAADGGHVWADGMMAAWYLAGEPRAVEAALGLGEHIAWAMAPGFKALGTHERSAGWSLRAIMAIYRGTYDPVYLDAARRIAAVALREQKPDQGGAWPHGLPKDHAGSQPGAVGNNLFLIGILLGGLQAYHEATGDAAVLAALSAGANWVSRSYDDAACGWPYSATTAAEPLYPPGVGLNQLIIGPLAYVGRVTDNRRLLEIADSALAATVTQGPAAFGKSLAQQIFFASGTLAELQRWYAATRPDRGASVLDGNPEAMAALLVRSARSERFNVRAPNRKEFVVRAREAGAELLALRTPHGSMQKGAEFARLNVIAAGGTTVFEDRCSTDERHESRCALPGVAGSEFRVVIEDDQRGVWTVKGDRVAVVARTGPDFRIGGVGRTRFYFRVPVGTREFSLTVLGVHTGAYGAVVLTPSGQIAGQFQGSNPGPALVAGAPKASTPLPPGHPERGQVVVTPQAEDTGKVWSVVLSAAMDIGVELVGVPPYLALAPADWFAPAP